VSEILTAVEPTQAPEAMTHARVIELIEKWRGLLLLNSHHIDVNFGTEACSDALCCAEMRCNTPYLSGHFLTSIRAFLKSGMTTNAKGRSSMNSAISSLAKRVRS